MGIDRDTAIVQLNSVIEAFNSFKSNTHNIYNRQGTDSLHNVDLARVAVRLKAALRRLSPPGSEYLEVLDERHDDDIVDFEYHHCCRLAGAANALRDDYIAGCLTSFRELLNAELYSDFLSMAEFLIQDERLKEPAAVIAGGVLEEHLRKLCTKHGIDINQTDAKGDPYPKKASVFNNDLKAKDIYGNNDHKQVTAWLGIRNSAAHAQHDAYTEDQVTMLITGLRSFIARFPA